MARSTRFSALLVMALATGCAAPQVVETALGGDLATLRRQLAEEQRAGLDDDTVVEVARAVAGREVRSSQGDTAVRRLAEVRPCAASLEHVLRARAGRPDEPGASAALLLVEAGLMSRRDALAHREDRDGAWRAVGARGTASAELGRERRRFMGDLDERVRGAALRAAAEAAAAEDTASVLAAARTDPSAENRRLALAAAGAIGGERVALGLVDRWTAADAAGRADILAAWAIPATAEAGGSRQLLRVAGTVTGEHGLLAATLLLRLGDASAHGVLLQAARSGTQAERVAALGALHAEGEGLITLEKASKDDDGVVAAAALERLVGVPTKAEAARKALRDRARGKSAPEAAVDALVRLGDTSAADRLAPDLTAPRAAARRRAGLGLVSLGQLSRAATALADQDPAVRTAVACAVLVRARGGDPGR